MSLTGVILSYGWQKGYGFISSEQAPGDVFFSRTVLPAELQSSPDLFPLKGKTVTFDLKVQDVEDGTKKPQAASMKFALVEGEMNAGVVKTYNPVKGFGFISSSSSEGNDYFFSKRDLPVHFQAAQLQGAIVGFKMSTSPDARLQAKDLVLTGATATGTQIAAPAPMGGMGGMTGMGGMSGMATGMGGVSGMGGMGGGMGNMMMGGMGMGMGVSPQSMGGQGPRMQGTVKNYNVEKGFGFCLCPSVGGDIYFKGQGLPITTGTTIEFSLKIMPDGKPQAREVTLPGQGPGAALPPPPMPHHVPAGIPPMQDSSMYPAVVASYNPNKGFGFFTVESLGGDVYFNKTVLPPQMHEADLKGMSATIAVKVTQDGKPQCARAEFSEGMPTGGVAADVKRRRIDGPAEDTIDGGGPFAGSISSYNPNKGFGFIQSDAAPSDIFFSAKQLPTGFAQSALQGKSVVFHLVWTADGKAQANNLHIGN